MSLLKEIETGVGIANQSLEFIDYVLVKIDRYKSLQSDKSAYLRLVYLEVINNLEVLQTIDLGRLKNSKPNEPAIKTVLKLLRTDILESIFYKTESEVSQKIYDRLKTKGKIDNKYGLLKRLTSKGEEHLTNKSIYENMLQAISFVVTKVHLLKTLENLDEEEVLVLNNVNIQVRLVNINQRLLMVKRKLDEFDEIKEMAR